MPEMLGPRAVRCRVMSGNHSCDTLQPNLQRLCSRRKNPSALLETLFVRKKPGNFRAMHQNEISTTFVILILWVVTVLQSHNVDTIGRGEIGQFGGQCLFSSMVLEYCRGVHGPIRPGVFQCGDYGLRSIPQRRPVSGQGRVTRFLYCVTLRKAALL